MRTSCPPGPSAQGGLGSNYEKLFLEGVKTQKIPNFQKFQTIGN